MLQKLMKLMRKDQKGFTLVELMIVVVIIGILIAIAIPVYNTIQGNAEKRACQANQRTIKSQLEVYNATKGSYPSDFDVFLGNKDYFDSIPQCPADDDESDDATNPDYGYSYDSASNSYTLYCNIASGAHSLTAAD